MITSLWRQNDVATSFRRHNDVIIASCVRWDMSRPSWTSVLGFLRLSFSIKDIPIPLIECCITTIIYLDKFNLVGPKHSYSEKLADIGTKYETMRRLTNLSTTRNVALIHTSFESKRNCYFINSSIFIGTLHLKNGVHVQFTICWVTVVR